MKISKKTALCLTCVLILCFGCKINQTKNKEKTGRWVYADTVNGIPYQSSGKYTKGLEKGIWKNFANNKLERKEQYKKGICEVTNYYKNGTVKSHGKTKMIVTDSVTHWHYTRDWYFFDENGQLIRTKNYADGTLVSDKKANGF